MKIIKIKNRYDGSVIYECEAECVREAVDRAVAEIIDLSLANLSLANLRRANLRRANLRRANLRRANLSDADLSNADLSNADLIGANLSRANLSDADLSLADLTPTKEDVWSVLDTSPAEVPALRQALIEGRVDGSTYEGECACLVGTIANARGCDKDSVPGLTPDSSRPAERFFLGIRKGDTPEDNQLSKIALAWVDEWTERNLTVKKKGEL